MAVTVIPDLSVISDCESTAGWSLGDLDSDTAIQGTYCLGEQVKSTLGPLYTYSLSSPISLSNGEHIYVWMLVNGVPDTKANGGYRVYLESTPGNNATWFVGGNDTLPTGWNNIVLDPAGTAPNISNGTLDLSNINVFGVQFKTLTSVVGQANNVFWDVIRYGTGLIATGTNFTFQDIAAIDDDVANKYGILQELDGVLFSQGKIQIGDGINVTELNSDGEVLAFRDKIVDTNLYKIFFSGTNTSVTAKTLTVLSAGNNDYTRPDIEVDSSCTNFIMDGCNIRRAGIILFNDSCEITNTVFTNCDIIHPSGSVFQNNTVSSSNSARALEILLSMSAYTGFSDCSFLNNNAATWIANAGTYSFDGHNFNNNLYDVENSSPGDVTINLSNGSNASTSLNSGGGTTTFVSTANFTLTNLVPNSEVRIYHSGATNDITTAGFEFFGVENASDTVTYQYGSDVVSSGKNAVVMIHAVNYNTIRFTVDLDGVDTSIPIQQQFDRNYSNPA